MVRTRKMDNMEKGLQTPRTSSYGRVRTERRIVINDDEDDDSDDLRFMTRRSGKARLRKVNLRPLKDTDSSESASNTNEEVSDRAAETHSKGKTVITDEEGTSGSSPTENATPMANSHSSNMTSDGGIRRSTRQRKFTYDTLNQGWLLGSARLRDFSTVTDDDGIVSHDAKDKSGKKVSSSGDGGDTDPDYEDMYSRIKRERRKAVSSFYNLPRKTRHGMANGTETEEFETEGDELEDSTEESSEEDEAPDDVRHSKYYLRQKKPIIERFQVPVEPTRNRKVSKNIFHLSPARPLIRLGRGRNFHASFRSPSHKSPKFKHRRRHATHNSSTSSSSSSSSEDEMRFERRKAKSMARARSRFFPMNFKEEDVASSCVLRDRVKIGSSLADVDPMAVDRNVSFESVGGLAAHIQSLKEMLLLPLMYPEIFEKFKITPPRGVLFYGAPGTGKTLVARALSNECSQGERKVAFFMRKGADCLSKWVGESERQLRLLFDQAYSMRPSIIFFDEIDGLAPVRSTRQDQIHSSIVSTLLALMDGLDNRGEVVVIGATNRIDAIDPALRRPGRFDREFNFPLPSLEARRSILTIHTKEWNPPLAPHFVELLSQKTVGYCGADIKALCAEAAFLALRRQFPEIYESKQKLLLDVSSVKIEAKDFSKAVAQLVPASHRSSVAAGRPLCTVVQPLLQNSLNSVLNALKVTFPQGFLQKKQYGQVENSCSTASINFDLSSDDESMDENQSALFPPCTNSSVSKMQARHAAVKRLAYVPSHRPRLLIAGHHGQGQSAHLAPAVLHFLEKFPIHKMDLPALFAVTAKSPEESCSQIFVEAQRVLPCILYLPHLAQWYDTLSDTVRATFLTLLEDLDPTAPLLLLATSDCPFDELPEQVQILFDPLHGEVVNLKNSNREERRMFFADLILCETKRAPKRKLKRQHIGKKKLAVAPAELPHTLSKAELKKLEENEERTLRELRMFLREILYKLARDRRFTMFTKPVDTLEVSDYLQVIQQPMDLEAMLTKVDLHCYVSIADFLKDIDLISQNALDYNPVREPSGKIIRHRACALKDTAHALVVSELDPEFEQLCEEIQEARRLRGCEPVKFAPKPYDARPQAAPNPQPEETTLAVSAEGNLVSDMPNHVDAQTSSKLYSQKLRGATVDNDQSLATTNGRKRKPVINNGARKIPSSRPNPILRRRHKSPWFGSRRRTFFRAPVQLKKRGTAATSKSKADGSVGLTNGFVDKEELQALGLAKLPNDAVKRNVEVRLAQLSWSTQDGAALSETLPIDPLTLPSDKCTKAESCLESSSKHLKREKHSSDELNSSASMPEIEVTFNTSSQTSGVDTLDKTASVDNAESESHSEQMSSAKEDDIQLQQSTADSSVISETDLGSEPEEEAHNQSVVINENQLANLLDRIVNSTSGCTVNTLQRLHCRLHHCICSHRQEWDRTMLLKDMENMVDKFLCSLSRHSGS